VDETNDDVVRECFELIDELSLLAVRVQKRADGPSRQALADFLKSVRSQRQTFFQMNISSGYTYTVDCALPHNTHPVRLPVDECQWDPHHVFCGKHRLGKCPQCGGPWR
jgi:hypothetical protein